MLERASGCESPATLVDEGRYQPVAEDDAGDRKGPKGVNRPVSVRRRGRVKARPERTQVSHARSLSRRYPRR